MRLQKIIYSALLFGLSLKSFSATYYSRASGNWNASSTWSTVACGGTAAGSSPSGIDIVNICNGHTISVTANVTTASVTINSGGTLKTGTTGGGNNRALTITSTFTIANGGIYIHNNTQLAATTIFAGTESFAANSTIQVDKWSTTADSICGGVNSNFGNLIFNWDTGLFLWKNSGLGTVRQVLGNLTTNAVCATYLDNGTANINASIGGNLTIGSEFRVKSASAGNAVLTVGGTTAITGAPSLFFGVYLSNGNFTLNTLHMSIANGTFYGIYNGDGNAVYNVTGIYSQSSGSFIGLRNTATFTAGIPTFTINTINFTGGAFIGNSSCNTTGGTILFNVTGNLNISFPDTSSLFAINRLATLSTTATTCKLTMTVGGNVTIAGVAAGEFNSNNGTGNETVDITGKLKVSNGKVYFNVIPGFGTNGHPATTTLGKLEISGGQVYLSAEAGALTATVTDSTVISGGILNAKGNTGTGAVAFNGLFSQTNGTFNIYNNASVMSPDIVSVNSNGNFSQTGGIISFSNNNTSGNATNELNIKGASYTIGGTGSMTRIIAGTGALFGALNFERAGTISFTRSGTHNIQQVKQKINNGTTVNVISGNVQVASHTTAANDYFTISSGGILALNSSQLYSNALAANSGITVADGGRLQLKHTSGLYNNSTIAALSNTGNMNFFLGPLSIIEYNGVATQVLTGINIGLATLPQHKYGKLEINHSGTPDVNWVYPTNLPTPTTAIYIRTELRLTAGELNLINASSAVASGGRTITIENNALGAITRTSGFIRSEAHDMSAIIKWQMASTTGSHIIPFGYNSTQYIPVIFNVNSGSAGDVSFATYHTAANNLPWPPGVTNLTSAIGLSPDNRNATVDRYWLALTSGIANASLTFNYASTELPVAPYDNASQLRAHRYNTGNTFWDPALPSQTAVAYNLTVPNINAFGLWTLANTQSPLPVELLSFTASPIGRKVILEWSTSSEKSNDYFFIERTGNYTYFNEIGIVKGNGTSNIMHKYSLIDHEPLEAVSYYRLVQVDLNGVKTYFKWTPVIRDGEVTPIYPNPANEIIYIGLPADQLSDISIINFVGKTIFKASELKLPYIEVSHFSPGSYILRYSTAGTTHSFPFIKQ